MARSHGMSRTRLYNVWYSMVRRCHVPSDSAYENYGGRGISVCEEWRNDPVAFAAHIGEPPSPKHEIDRYPNNDGNYEPGNVRWATHSENNRNTRRTCFVEHEGKRVPLTTLCEQLGVPFRAVYCRVQGGTSLADALRLAGTKAKPTIRTFSADDVRQIRAMKAAGKSFGQLTKQFNCSVRAIQAIVYRETYKDVA
jgi:hypothetical protein